MATPLGQIFTPRPVAELALALGLEGLARPARILDPACGDGIFLACTAAAGFTGAEGIDIDPIAVTAARAKGLPAARGNFLAAAPPDRPYDAVVGNPPYVRQELLGKDKERIAARIAADFPDLEPGWWGGREDLALAFVARALRFVRPGGRVAFVLSAAVLEAGHRDALARLVRGRAAIETVVASPRERWFPDAAVHAVIVILRRGEASSSTLCARLTVPVARARVAGQADLARVADLRRAAPGEALAPLLRAPDVWLRAARTGELVPLAELAGVKRGATSGANEFFYLARAEAQRRGIEARFLAPVLRTPRTLGRIHLDEASLPTVAFVCDADRDGLRRHPGAAAHVAAHEALAARPTLRARPSWWQLPVRPARLFLTKAYSARFVQGLAARPVIPDQRVYAVTPRAGVPVALLAAALNGTLAALALESLGRASLGEGALEWSVADAVTLPVLDVRRLDARARAAVLATFGPLSRRLMGDVFAEARAADRRQLDEALSAAAPALRGLVPELGTALANTVASRLARARNIVKLEA